MNLKDIASAIIAPLKKTTEKVASDKKYVILNVSSYPFEVTKEQYDDIKNSAGKDGFIESETDDTIFIKVIK